MIGGQYDAMGLGLGPHLTMVGGGGGLFGGGGDDAGMTQPGALGSASQSSGNGAVLLAWGIVGALLVCGYLFFSPITL